MRRLYGPQTDVGWSSAEFYYRYDKRPSFVPTSSSAGVKETWGWADGEARTNIGERSRVIVLPESQSPLAVLKRLERDYPQSDSAAAALHERGLYPDMGLLINRVLAMRPAGTDVWSPRDSQQASILTAMTLAMVDAECAKQILRSAAPQQPAAEGAGAVMENLDLLQAWALIDLEYTVRLIESRVEASKGNDFWSNYLICTLELLTTPPEQRVQVLLRHSGGHRFPGTEP